MAWSRSRWTPPLYSLLLAVVIVGPLLGPGYLLLRDAVSTPRSYFTDSAWGIADTAARAVPQDAAIAALSTVFDGGLVVKTILLLALWLTGWGAAVMARTVLPTAPLPALLVASTVAVWNPYVAERLLQGHWSLLVGYATLPWTVVAALAVREGRSWWALGVCLAAAGLTPTGALLAATIALVVLALPGGARRGLRVVGALGMAAVASAPWLVATAVSGSGVEQADPAGWAAFAARAEPGLGTLGSLAGLGGIWNSDAVPDSRTGSFAFVGTALLLTVVALGVRPLIRRRRNPVIVGLAVVALLAIAAPALAATGPGLAMARALGETVPGAGLLRDSQKWVALAMPIYSLAAAAAFSPRRRPNRVQPAALSAVQRTRFGSAVAIAALLIALPDLGWGVGNSMRPVVYPESWQAVAAELQGGDGDVAVLPAGMFRLFPYSDSAPVLDPAPRMLPLDVLQTGELIVAGGTVRGEGVRATEVQNALLAGEPVDVVAELGVGWVLVENATPGELGRSEQTLNSLAIVYSDDQLTLYRVPAPVLTESRPVAAVVVAHLAWALLLLGGLAVGLLSRVRVLRTHQT
ncbi:MULTISPECIES: hypothetical protein [unclassified Rhodococcus (in: high G+C Gram-positive bacteria)]|uniref:hypothetical protein n=1 Tax=unclassified Rhodococcus (in: high G+C Gram-positive bacteria) TaxID=192944 RepID=UPI000B9BFAEC|nr:MULTISPECIES: hypothetical protein [unclassified Rhodococcus (in: high G+C Gram-positive bacteria)]OZE38509.1 hypothetical protein CH259_08110 [Rhodococcus sp. 05-2254-4]OZE47271.1 hypothetical protein CH283_19515 [Rhodococcus sp. 05-2254-2]OZE51519.1 hypothetical protein CH261_00855 [Rhodococcus sp. 05-2254-3]